MGLKESSGRLFLYAAVPAALIATLQFIATTFSLPVKTTIATALFMMFGLSYSLMNCSYGAMIPAITKNPNERAQLAAYRQGGATIGLLICTVAFIPLQSLFSDSTVGYALRGTDVLHWWLYFYDAVLQRRQRALCGHDANRT